MLARAYDGDHDDGKHFPTPSYKFGVAAPAVRLVMSADPRLFTSDKAGMHLFGTNIGTTVWPTFAPSTAPSEVIGLQASMKFLLLHRYASSFSQQVE